MLNQPFKLRDLNGNMKSSWLKQRGNWMMNWQKTFLTWNRPKKSDRTSGKTIQCGVD